MNTAHLTGNLTRDPEFKQITEEFCVCNMRLAYNHYNKNKPKDKQEVSFFSIKATYKQAEYCMDNLKKGDRVYIEGSMKQETFTTRDGVIKEMFVITCREISKVAKFEKKDENKINSENSVDADEAF